MFTTPFTLERKRVKYAWIYVSAKLEVRVIIPLRFKEQDVQAFIRAKTPWVEKKLAYYKEAQEQAPKFAEHEILYFGNVIPSPLALYDDEALKQWYRTKAKEYFHTRVPELAAQFGFTFNKISLRDAKTRWGSCSAKKNLSFNWRLVKAPATVIDYIILHELAHTVVLNHSRKFWRLVASVCPEFEEAKLWLRKHGSSL